MEYGAKRKEQREKQQHDKVEEEIRDYDQYEVDLK